MDEREHSRLYLSDKRARKIAGWRASLDIFEQHGKTDKWLISGAEHDILYTNYDAADIPEDTEDGRALIALGWHLDSESWKPRAWVCFA